MPKLLSLKILIVSVIVVSLLLNVYLAFFKRTQVTVYGSASSNQKNEIATFSAYMQYKDPDKEAAVRAFEEGTSVVTSALKDYGIPAEDLKTLNVNVYREEVWNPTTSLSEDKDWVATGTIEIKVSDVALVDGVGQLLATLDIRNFNGPNFAVNNESVDDEALLNMAYEDAYAKATALAQMQGMKVKRVVRLAESGAMTEPGVVYDMGARGAGGGGGFPFEPGTSENQKSIMVTFELCRW